MSAVLQDEPAPIDASDADHAAELLRDILLRGDRESIADLRDELTALEHRLADRDQLVSLLAPVLNRALSRSARDTEAQLVAALYPVFFPLMRRAIRGWFEHQIDRFRTALG